MILRVSIIVYLFVLGCAVLLYPGGSQWDAMSVGYHWYHNFLSDLGNTRSWNQESNLSSMLLFLLGHACLLGGLWHYRQRLEPDHDLRQPLALHILCIVGLCATPFNLLPTAHHIFSTLFVVACGWGLYRTSNHGLFYRQLFYIVLILALWAGLFLSFNGKAGLVPLQKVLIIIVCLWYWRIAGVVGIAGQLTPKPAAQTKAMANKQLFAYDLWYMAMASSDLKKGAMLQKTILSQTIVFARDKQGHVIAMADRCPHRGMPLSFGNFDGENIECAYHGWCFNKQGTCTKIPALTEHDKVDISKISSTTYHIEERNGIIFIFMPEDANKQPSEKPAFMEMPYEEFDGEFFKVDNPHLPCDIDNANFGLLDPAHVPFVHKSWWWRPSRERKMKEKSFRPWGLGFQMIAHTPSANSKGLKAVGGKLETEITFQLPGYRIECIRGNDKETIALTALTPINETEVEFTQFLKFPKGHYLNMFKWVLRYLGRGFMAQDVDAFTKQAQGNRDTDKMMYVGEVDQQGKWYFQVKKTYQDAQQNGGEFENPVEEATLHWYT